MITAPMRTIVPPRGFAFTPGPWLGEASWVIAGAVPNRYRNHVNGAKHEAEDIKFYGGDLICESVDRRNVYAIAAAPHMIEALAAVAASPGRVAPDVLALVHAALAKAGRGV